MKDIWQHVHSDLESMRQLGEILSGLQQAEKIQGVPELGGFLPRRKAIGKGMEGMVNFELLTEEERLMRK
jgi:hypothetical protein